MFEKTTVVAFELSNLCQYAWLHAKCPLHRYMETPFVHKMPLILKSEIVAMVVDELSHYGWAGEINFHQYNEPLLDPRLLTFVATARQLLPDSPIRIVTNGMYLTFEFAQELVEIGVTHFDITPYGGNAFELAQHINHIAVTRVLDYPIPGLLDDRLKIYDRLPQPLAQPCYEPLIHVTITCKGYVALCCQDWRRDNTFGNLQSQSLAQILASDEVQYTYQRLSQGDRFLAVCQRCDTGRGI